MNNTEQNRCIVCSAYIPEGRMVCSGCDYNPAVDKHSKTEGFKISESYIIGIDYFFPDAFTLTVVKQKGNIREVVNVIQGEKAEEIYGTLINKSCPNCDYWLHRTDYCGACGRKLC